MGAFTSKSQEEATTTTRNKRRGPPPAISATDRATLDLKNARDRLQKYKGKLEQDDAKIVARAKKAKADGNTKAALNLLKIRKLKTREVTSCEAQLLNVMQMVQTIDSKQNEVQVLAAMKEGKNSLQRMHEETTVDDVLNLMDEIQEQNELEQEMNDILVGSNVYTSLSVEDESEIEAELEALMMGTSSQQQQQQTEQLPVEIVALKKEAVMAAVKQDGLALQSASDEMKADTEVVLEAVKQNGLALQYASNRMKDDTEVVSAAVKQNSYALHFASERMRFDLSGSTSSQQQTEQLPVAPDTQPLPQAPSTKLPEVTATATATATTTQEKVPVAS